MIHLVTGEYPPLPGGVSDYTALLAHKLVDAGEQVHVWTGGHAPATNENGVLVHRLAGAFSPASLRNLDRALQTIAAPRRILVQWTPHSFGCRSLNLAFPAWIWKRARIDNDRVELMIHEPFVAFGEGSWRQTLAAIVHRAMIALLLNAAVKIWVSIPAWESRLHPWCFGRQIPFEWLPVPSNIDFPGNPHANPEPLRIGHFGTFRPDIVRLLQPALCEILERTDATMTLAGRGSQDFRARFATAFPALADRVSARGELAPSEIAAYLRSCEILLQPYPDGISTRRGTAMAALSAGVPMVTNLGKLSEGFWPQSQALELADSANPIQLASSALRLMLNPQRRRHLSENARVLYNSRFDVRHTVAALLSKPLALEAAA